MQVVPICIVACLLVVSLSSAKDFTQGACHRLEQVKLTNDKKARCRCIGFKKGRKFWLCELIVGCKHIGYYAPGEKYEGCVCKKGPDPYKPNDSSRYHWLCTECYHGSPLRYHKIDEMWTVKLHKTSTTCTCTRLSFGPLKVICQNTICAPMMTKYIKKTALGKCTCPKRDGRSFDIWKCS